MISSAVCIRSLHPQFAFAVCIRSTLIVRRLWHQIFSRCYSAFLLKPLLKNAFVSILSGETVPICVQTCALSRFLLLISCNVMTIILYVPDHQSWFKQLDSRWLFVLVKLGKVMWSCSKLEEQRCAKLMQIWIYVLWHHGLLEAEGSNVVEVPESKPCIRMHSQALAWARKIVPRWE